MALSDDVAIRTGRRHGTTMRRAAQISEVWGQLAGFFTLDPTVSSKALAHTIPMVSGEINASLYLCVTGWYRQSLAALRTGLEL